MSYATRYTDHEYGYTIVGVDGEGGTMHIKVKATPLDQPYNKALQQAFDIANSHTLQGYDTVYILSGDDKRIVDHVKGQRLTLQQILSGEINQFIIPL